MNRSDQPTISPTKYQRMLESNLICEMCMQPYNKDTNIPLILPNCGHTLCKVCVAKILETSEAEFTCPFCCITMKDNFIDISYFPKNYSLAREIDLAQKDACKDHHKYLDMFCLDCTQKICNKCYSKGVHREHNCEYVDDMIIDAECQLQDLKDILCLVEVNESAINRLIDARKQSLKWIIRDKYTKLIKYIEKHMKEAIKILDVNFEKLDLLSLYKAESKDLKDGEFINVLEWKNQIRVIESDWTLNQSLETLKVLKNSQHVKYVADVLKWTSQDHRAKAKKLLESIRMNFDESIRNSMNKFFQIEIQEKDKPFEMDDKNLLDKLTCLFNECNEPKKLLKLDTDELYEEINLLKIQKVSNENQVNDEAYYMYMLLLWNLERFGQNKVSLSLKKASIPEKECSILMSGVSSVLKPDFVEVDFSYSLSMEKCLNDFSNTLLINTNLQSLLIDISGSLTCLSSTKSLALALPRLRNLKKLNLDFSSCKTVSSKDFTFVLKGISQIKSLTSLVVSFAYCNNFDANCFAELTEVVSQFDKEKFKRLDFELGPIDKNMPKEVLDKIFEETGKLKNLSLFGLTLKSPISDENLKSLCEMFKGLKKIKFLNLDLKPNLNIFGGLMLQVSMLTELKLLSLSISDFNQLKPELMDIILRSILFLENLSEFYVNIPDFKVPATHLVHFERLKKLEKLNCLGLSFEFEYSGIENFKKAFKLVSEIKNLKQISINAKVLEPKVPLQEINIAIRQMFVNQFSDINILA